MIWPDRIEPIMMPRVIGSSSSPASVGDRTLDDLQVERQGGQATEHRDTDEHRGDRGHPDGLVAEHRERQDRLLTHAVLLPEEADGGDDTDDVADDRVRGAPAPLAALLGDQQQRHEREREQRGPGPVDAVIQAGVAQVQRLGHDGEGRDADRHVDEEDPAPAVDAQDAALAGEEPADDRAEHGCRAEHGEEVALVLGALARGNDVADDRQRQREQAAGAQTLHRAVERERAHRGGERAQHGPEDEQRDGDDEQLLAAVDVAELAVERRDDRRGDEVGGGRPGLVVQALEVVGDGPDGRGDDGLVERGEEHAHHQADEDGDDLPVAQRPGRGIDRRGGRRVSGGGRRCS
jgi:hypothetical protein